MVTLKDVALEAGVSAHSVSAVLNGKARQYRISPATSERITAMAQQMGYDPEDHRGARQMAARKHGTKILNNVLALCTFPTATPLHRQPYESEVLDGVESAADRHNLDVLQCRLRPQHLPRLIEKGDVDGIIILSGSSERLRQLRTLGIPIVHLGSTFPGCHSVSAAHEVGARLATEHLIGLGHRHIAFIGHEIQIALDESTLAEAAQKRLNGFRIAMEMAALPVEWIDSTLRESFPDYGARAFETLWEKSRGKITAVVCYNDTLAMGVLQAAQKLGLKVPQDLSVVGFDNVSEDYHFEPRIASIHFDREQMGVRAVEILMQVREADRIATEYIEEKLPVTFVAGVTTALAVA